jgi:hypothetical protein
MWRDDLAREAARQGSRKRHPACLPTLDPRDRLAMCYAMRMVIPIMRNAPPVAALIDP